MAVIDYTDVATAIGRPISSEDEQEQVTQWISDVELLIGARLGDPAELDQDLLAYVEREAVIARMRSRENRNADSGGGGNDVDSGQENYFLRILEPWWVLLSPTPSATPTGAFSISPSASTSLHLPWCSLYFGALYCSCGVDIAGYPIFELSDY